MMRSSMSRALSVVLLAFVCFRVGADDRAVTSQPTGRHWMDFRLAVSPGAFFYMQKVDGGYYISGYPYDLSWYGLLGELTGIVEVAIPALMGVGLGIGGCVFYTFNPSAVDDSYHFLERADTGALGGYGGVSASYSFGDLRANAIAGYGGTGVVSYYGGSGPALSVGFDYPILKGTIRAGIGARYLIMYLRHPGSSSVSAEKGPYLAFSVSAVVDWIP